MLKYFNCSSLVTVWCKQQQTFSYYFASHVFSSLSPSFSRFRGPRSVILQQIIRLTCMASALKCLFTQYGSQLSDGQRMHFVYNLLRANHPASCEAWEYIW